MQQLKTDIIIRKFEERDYAGVVAVSNAVLPDRPGTVEELRYDDEHYDKQFVNDRYVAEDRSSGTTLGYAGLWHSAWAFHPRKFGMEIRVHPDHQRNGIGSALWLRLQEALRVHQAIDVKTYIWEKIPSGIAFAARHGFHEVMRAWESRLEIGTFDFKRFIPHVDQALASGVTITTLAAERARDAQNLKRIHAIDVELSADVPRPPDETRTPIGFNMWHDYAVDNNAPMLAINEKFGFVRQPAWITFMKEF